MAFNKNNIKGLKSGVGSALLNEMSKEQQTDMERTVFLPYEDLRPSPLNKDISKNDIDSLASQIRIGGQKQALVVVQDDDGKWEILAGERRYLAIGRLIAAGDYRDDHMVECKIEHLEKQDMPLSDDDKKRFTWLTTNQQREKTDGDRYIEVTAWKELILKLRSEGVSLLVMGMDENGNEVSIDITGKKTREIIAEQTNMSQTQVGKIESIEAHGTEELKQRLKNDEINIRNAARVAKLPEEEQNDFIKNAIMERGKITHDDVDEAVEKVEKTMPKPPVKSPNTAAKKRSVTKSEIDDKWDSIMSAFRDNEKIELSETEYREIDGHIQAIANILGVG